MIKFVNVSKRYGAQVIFDEIGFSMVAGERLGLLGRNGSGKTTLFRLITAEEAPDQGEIVQPKDYRCGYLRQHLSFDQDSILNEVLKGLPHQEEDQSYLGKIILSGLGFSAADMQKPAGCFSGGFQIRVELARVLVSKPNLLLLDEPTNYLDIVSLRWLERFLREWQNELIVISHDHSFMDQVIADCMLIRRNKLRKIHGSTEALYFQVAEEDRTYEQTRKNLEVKKRDMQVFIDRFRAKATKAAQVQSRIKDLERLGEMEELKEEACLDFAFRSAPFSGKFLLETQDLGFAYPSMDGTPGPLLIKNLNLQIGRNERLAVIGKNGKGKSTLLRVLAGELTPSAGAVTLSVNSRIGYFGQTNIQTLRPGCTVEEEIADADPILTRTQVRNIAGTMMFSSDAALKKVQVLSGGEKSRVLLGKILAKPTNLLLLDEPTNHLDQESVAAMLDALGDYPGALLIVTHSELILRRLAKRLVVFQGDQVQVLHGGYDYFLEKVGWEDELLDQMTASTSLAAKNTEGASSSQADLRKARAEQRRQRALGGLLQDTQPIEVCKYLNS
jgi:ATP-binding cassette subfamily F protein 3